MRSRPSLAVVLCSASCALLLACSSSEETGAGRRAENPQTTQVTGDSVRLRPNSGSTKKENLQPKKKVKTSPKFKARQDTVAAAAVRRTSASPRPTHKIVRPENPMYTVQLGAFSNAANALREQKRAKDRFKDEPIFNRFDASDKMYRVSVGKFSTGDKASEFRHGVMKKYPADYKQCWIIYIAR